MRTLIKHTSVYHNHRFEEMDLLLEGGLIQTMGELKEAECDQVYDAG